MGKTLAAVKAAAAKAKAALVHEWQREPVRVRTLAAASVVFVLAKFGVVVPEASVGQALALTLPILLGGEAARSKVTPTS